MGTSAIRPNALVVLVACGPVLLGVTCPAGPQGAPVPPASEGTTEPDAQSATSEPVDTGIPGATPVLDGELDSGGGAGGEGGLVVVENPSASEGGNTSSGPAVGGGSDPPPESPVTVSVVIAGGEAREITVDPASSPSFSIDIRLATGDETVVSLEMRLEANQAGIMSIASGAYGADWDSGLAALPIPMGPVDGKTAVFGSIPVAGTLSGTSTVATLDLAIDPQAPPGQYTIHAVNIVAGDETFTQLSPDPQPGPPFAVRVAPSTPQ